MSIITAPDKNVDLKKSSSTQNIAILCLPGLDSFLPEITGHLEKRFNVKSFCTSQQQEIEDAIKWADVIWIEWANEMAVAVTNAIKLIKNKRIICRLHSYEAFTESILKINWYKVDDLILVSNNIKEYLQQQITELEQMVGNIQIIPNGVDLNKFKFRGRKAGYDIAYLGSINFKKGPMLLLHAFQQLVQADQNYHLHIAGNFQDVRYQLYYQQMLTEMNLKNNVTIYGWVEDVEQWLIDKNYIVCSSVLESQGMGIMEAMASGIKPVVHNFAGAKQIYDQEFLWNTIPEFVQMIQADSYNSNIYRQFVEQNYSLKDQLKEIDVLIDSTINLNDKKSDSLRLIRNYAGKMYACSTDCPVCMNLKYEMEHAEFAGKFIKQGSVVLDLGAHAGLYSVYAANRMRGSGEIHAFEIETHSFKTLRRNAQLHPLITAHNIAVWSQDTNLEVTISDINPGMHWVKAANNMENSEQKNTITQIKATALDTYFSDDFKVDFIKLDVEGAELHVLQGLKNILQRSENAGLLVEFVKEDLARNGHTPEDVLLFLESLGFSCINLNREFLIDGIKEGMTIKAHFTKDN